MEEESKEKKNIKDRVFWFPLDAEDIRDTEHFVGLTRKRRDVGCGDNHLECVLVDDQNLKTNSRQKLRSHRKKQSGGASMAR